MFHFNMFLNTLIYFDISFNCIFFGFDTHFKGQEQTFFNYNYFNTLQLTRLIYILKQLFSKEENLFFESQQGISRFPQNIIIIW